MQVISVLFKIILVGRHDKQYHKHRFIKLYRSGQASIMSDLLLALEEILEGGQEREDESEEEDS